MLFYDLVMLQQLASMSNFPVLFFGFYNMLTSQQILAQKSCIIHKNLLTTYFLNIFFLSQRWSASDIVGNYFKIEVI